MHLVHTVTQNESGKVSQRMVINHQSFQRGKQNSEFSLNPKEYLEDSVKGIHVQTEENRRYNVVHVACPALTLFSKGACKSICLDGTFKVAPTRGIVVTIGCMMHSSFVPLTISVFTPKDTERVPLESEDDIVQCLSFFKAQMGPEYCPEYVMRDMGKGFVAGIRGVFPAAKQLTCWFHVADASQRWLREHKVPEETSAVIMNQLTTMHKCRTMLEYRNVARLIEEEAHSSPIIGAFWEFTRQAGRLEGGVNERWLRFHTEGQPTTNNGQERYHRTLRQDSEGKSSRLACVMAATCLVRTMSLITAPPIVGHNLAPYFERREERLTYLHNAAKAEAARVIEALQTAHLAIQIFRVRKVDETFKLVSEREFSVLEGNCFRTLESFKAYKSVKTFNTATCDCSLFLDYGFCAHVIAARSYSEFQKIARMRVPLTVVTNDRVTRSGKISKRTREEEI